MTRTRTWMALLLLIGVAGVASAHQGGTGGGAHQDGMTMGGGMMGMMHGGMGRHHGMMGHHGLGERPLISLTLRHKEELKLTPEQVRHLETLRRDFRKAAIRRGAELKVAEVELEELRRQESVDLAKVEAQLRRIEALRVEQRLHRIKTIEAGKAVLTSEQRKQLDALGARPKGGHAAGMMGCPMMGGMMGPSGGGATK